MTLLSRRFLLPITMLFVFQGALVGCDDGETDDAGIDATVGIDGGERDSATPFPDGTVFCDTDEECDDGVDCTRDSCGMGGFCRNVVDPASCDDGIFCNGVEQCDPLAGGCVPGMRETCNDDDVCTIDRCNEETKSCDRFPRDQDDDGDADWFCEGGTDCDDGDPRVSGLVSEVCADSIDNDCDEIVDEAMCGRPRNDTCDDPLDVSAGGFYLLNTDGAAPDYALGCRTTTRDLVASFTLTERQSVTIEGEGDFFTVAVSLRTTCTDRASEIDCQSGFPGVVRRRALDPGTYYVIVAASSTGEIGLTVTFGPPMDPPTNDTCSAPIDVSAGGTFAGSTVETADNQTSSCGIGPMPDLMYTFTTTADQNVRISALAATGESMAYSVRSACGTAATELSCNYGNPAQGTLFTLPAGTYFIIVEGPTSRAVDFMLDVMFLPPTPPPPCDTCATACSLPTDGTVVAGDWTPLQNDHDVSCGFRYRDAVYSFTLSAASDVTIDLDGGTFSNLSTRPTCDVSASQIRCTTGDPVRQRIRNLAAGTYYLLAESNRGSTFNIAVTATTPPTVPTAVSGNDTCAGAHVIPPGGGLFTGSTASLVDDIASCRCAPVGSNDAVFRLDLTARSRVIASTEGSTFDTVLHVHRGMCTAGADLYCDDDGGAGVTSLIDQMIDPGTYYIVVDGFGSFSSGSYTLEVTVTP